MQNYAEEAVADHMASQQKLFYEHWKGRNPWVQRRNSETSAGGYEEIPGFIESVAKRTGVYRSLKKKFGDDEKKIFAEMNKKTDMTMNC